MRTTLKPQVLACWKGLAYLAGMALFVHSATATEPTSPIVFLDPEGEQGLRLVVDEALVEQLQLDLTLLYQGAVRTEETLDLAQFEREPLAEFPVAVEVLHLMEQAEIPYAEPDHEPPVSTHVAQAVAYHIPLGLEAVRRQEDGYYGISLLARAHWRNGLSHEWIEEQHFVRLQLQDSEPRWMSLEEYSAQVDPIQVWVNPDTGNEETYFAGAALLNVVPLESTGFIDASMFELAGEEVSTSENNSLEADER